MVQIFKSFQTIDWGGGKSTELFIFPETSNYKERDFKFRLSTATVEAEESVFTPLTGVQRKLMVLEGEMWLEHEGHHEAQLGKFEVDEFDGGWNTRSKGCCTDFNLMLKDGAKGSIKGLKLGKNEVLEGEFFGNHFFVWLFKGNAKIHFANEEYFLKEKELLCISDAIQGRITMEGQVSTDLVILDVLS